VGAGDKRIHADGTDPLAPVQGFLSPDAASEKEPPTLADDDAPTDEYLKVGRDLHPALRLARGSVTLEPRPRRPGHPYLGLVLLIDDNAANENASTARRMLLAAGHEVIDAQRSDDALTIARREQPELIVISANLSSGDAMSLVSILKHDPDTRHGAVLCISDTTPREEVLRAGADDVLLNPVAPAHFRDVCNRLIEEASVQTPRILVVDADPLVRMICREVLQDAGYRVRDCQTSGAALLEAQRLRPDLLLIDTQLPDLSGFDLVVRLRSHPNLSMTPFMFVTAHGGTTDKIRAFRLGAEDYVVKPFVAEELCARVQKVLERHARAVGASPTTQLPGANVIQAEIERRLASRDPDVAFCYLDIDNFKSFNDHYGYARADGVIRQVGDLVRSAVRRAGNDDDFIGHIAGDDFVIVSSVQKIDDLCAHICATFDQLAPLYYNKEDRQRGYIETLDRYGTLRRFPILAVSLAAVTMDAGEIEGYSQLAERATAGKRLAKTVACSSYVRDGHIVIG
jgi:PleD family two-component response regulator